MQFRLKNKIKERTIQEKVGTNKNRIIMNLFHVILPELFIRQYFMSFA
jgi:hypothetical protein